MVETSAATVGSCRMTSAILFWYSTSFSYEVPCAASVVTEI